jgi:XTP/dITP diphosphohydrolase
MSESDQQGSRLVELVRVMDTLRVNCPWDARQTHASLAPHLMEESYEALDALAADDQAAVREELGDVLLQVVFHARIAQERTDGTGYDIDDVAADITDKLTRRHPHVFGDVAVSGPDEVYQNWDAIKAAERAAKAGDRPVSVLDGVPMSQPSLSLAAQLLRRAGRAGAPPSLAREPSDAMSPLGQELLDLVARALESGLDPELELRKAARAYSDRVRAWEAQSGEARGAPGGRPPGPAPSGEARGAPGGRPPGPAPSGEARGAPGGRPPGPAQPR